MVTLRPLLIADIPAHAALLAAVEAVDGTGEHYNEGDLVEEYANPDLTLGHDVIGAFDGDDLVGVVTVLPRGVDATHQRIQLDGAVRPARRGEGIGTLLVRAMLDRADAIHAERHPQGPARFRADGLSGNDEQAALLTGAGLQPERWSFAMRTQLAALDLDPPAALPEGLALLTWSPAHDRAVHEAHNEVFLDHPDFTPWTDAMWEQWVSGSRNFRPALSVVLVEEDAPERVVAYVQTNEYDAYFEATGRREAHLAKVGTRREWRGRGVAGAMLRAVLRRCREAGFDEASLGVDSANPTGALGVYERAGFEVEHRWTSYVVERPPLRDDAWTGAVR